MSEWKSAHDLVEEMTKAEEAEAIRLKGLATLMEEEFSSSEAGE